MIKMASLHTGCKESVLLTLEHEDFSLYLTGKTPKTIHPSVHQEEASFILMSREPVALVVDQSYNMGSDTKVMGTYKPLFFEQTSYNLVIQRKTDCKIHFEHAYKPLREAIQYIDSDKRILAGILNFKNHIGYTNLEIYRDGVLHTTLTIEIYPTKMSYKEDYKMLLEDVNTSIYNLAYDFLKATYGIGSHQERSGSLTEFYSLLEVHKEVLCRSLKLITSRPHHELALTKEFGRPRPKALRHSQARQYLMKHPQNLRRHSEGYDVERALNVKKQVTYETKENQWVKYWANELILKVDKLKSLYKNLNREVDDKWISKMTHFQGQLKNQLRHSAFEEIGMPTGQLDLSFVFQMAPGYKDFYKHYKIVMGSIHLVEGIYGIATKNVAELYEYWCFIKLGMLLKSKYHLKSNGLLKINHKGIFVNLEKGKASSMTFENPKTKETFKLLYNPKMQKLPTITQQPDNVLELKKEQKDCTYKYVLDAKYKVELDENKNYLCPKEEDINTMHRYRDAIVYQDQHTAGYERTVFGAVVLFPGQDELNYRQDPLYQSIETVGIGGLPFMPSHTTLVEDFLEKLVDTSGYSHYMHTIFPQGTKQYIEDIKIEERNTLVGATRNQEQVERVKRYKIYHIPLENVRNHFMHIKYVALFESSKGKGHKGGIYYYGKVSSTQIKKRKDLVKAFPTTDNLEKEYVVYSLEDLRPLKTPIYAKGYGIMKTMYTNKTLLQHATYIPELKLETKEEFEAYLQIKRLIDDYDMLENQPNYHMYIGGVALYIETGHIIFKNQHQEESVSIDRFMKNPKAYMQQYGLLGR